MTILELLEELRAIGQTGLNFSKDEYDIKRYKRLIELASLQYSELSGISKEEINKAFLNDLAYATPKVGVEGILFKDDKLLLVKRDDNKKWCLPCGWSEINESPYESVRREVFEETGLTVKPKEIFEVMNVFAGQYMQPHSYYQLLFLCEYVSGDLKTSDETIEVGFFDLDEINSRDKNDWHRNHYAVVTKAFEYYFKTKK
jgi:ADP-ribose pyrophosphatase YjhB (NUDIX family)